MPRGGGGTEGQRAVTEPQQRGIQTCHVVVFLDDSILFQESGITPKGTGAAKGEEREEMDGERVKPARAVAPL
jgi:hypothetical protein